MCVWVPVLKIALCLVKKLVFVLDLKKIVRFPPPLLLRMSVKKSNYYEHIKQYSGNASDS